MADITITKAQLEELFPRAAPARIAAFANQGATLLSQFGIAKTPTRLQYFLAQLGHESGGLTAVEENLNYSAKRLLQVFPSRFASLADAQKVAGKPEAIANIIYASRIGNGDAKSGDGFRFRGRGYIQITGRANYKTIGTFAKIDLLGDPDRAASVDDALLIACAFWDSRNINVPCDAQDFVKVTKLINGGINGLADRREWLDKARRALVTPPAVQPTPEVVRQIQIALVARGFTSVGAADGLIGKRTSAAIQLLRHRNGLPEVPDDKIVDQALLDLLDIES